MRVSVQGVLVLLALGLVAWGCSGPSAGPEQPGAPGEAAGPQSTAELPAGAEPVAYRTLGELEPLRTSSGLTQRQRVVVRDEAAWASLWGTLTRTAGASPDVPPVDFSRERVIVVAMGQRPSGGHAIGVQGVRQSEGRLYVVVEEVAPGKDCMVSAALTQPVAAVVVPAGEGPVEFIEQSRVQDCSGEGP